MKSEIEVREGRVEVEIAVTPFFAGKVQEANKRVRRLEREFEVFKQFVMDSGGGIVS